MNTDKHTETFATYGMSEPYHMAEEPAKLRDLERQIAEAREIIAMHQEAKAALSLPEYSSMRELRKQLAAERALADRLAEALNQCDPGDEWTIEEGSYEGSAFCELSIGDIRLVRAAITEWKEARQ